MAGLGRTAREERASKYGVDLGDDMVFTNWELGGEYRRAVTVKNVSNRLLKISYKLPKYPGYVMEFPDDVTLSPGTSADIMVVFRPFEWCQTTDYIDFEVHNRGSFRFEITALLPRTSVKFQECIDFGFVAVNYPDTKTFDVYNDGEVPVTYSWSVNAPFQISPRTVTVEPRRSAKHTIKFAPGDASVVVSTAVLKAGDYTKVLKVSGVGKYPFISVAEDELTFEQVMTGHSATLEVTVRNQSLVDAEVKIQPVDDVDSKFTPFKFDSMKQVVAPEQLHTFQITFSPTATGFFYLDRFDLVTPGGNDIRLTCSGWGVGPKVSLDKSSINFGDVSVGSKQARAIHIDNHSGVPAVYQVVLEDSDSSFTLSNKRGTLAPFSQQSITVAFNPVKPLNYYRRIWVLIRDQSALQFDLLATAFDPVTRPAPMKQLHVDRYYKKKATSALASTGGGSEYGLSDFEILGDYFDENSTCPCKIQEEIVEFGGCQRLRLGPRRTITVTNSGDKKMLCVWKCPGETIGPDHHPTMSSCRFAVHPPYGDVRAGQSTTFQVQYQPDQDNYYDVQTLECFVLPKTDRTFRLVDEDTFGPPHCLTLTASGNTYVNNLDPIIGSCSFNVKTIILPPSQLGDSVYQTVQLTNIGETPAKYEIHKLLLGGGAHDDDEDMAVESALLGEAGEDFLAVKPRCGNIPPRSHQIIAFKFTPRRAGKFEVRLDAIINNVATHPLQITAIGEGCAPVLELDGDAFVNMKPTHVGTSSSRSINVYNPSRIPVSYFWKVPKKYSRCVTVSPASGELLGNQTQAVTLTFTAVEEGDVELKIPCYCSAAANASSTRFESDPLDLLDDAVGVQGGGLGGLVTSTLGGPKLKPSCVLKMTGKGTEGAVHFEPLLLDFNAVLMSDSVQKEVALVNPYACDVHFTLEVQEEACAVAPVGGGTRGGTASSLRGARRGLPLVELSVTKGTIPAQSVLPVFVTFSPCQRRYHSFRVMCHMQVNGLTFAHPADDVIDGKVAGAIGDGMLPTAQYPEGQSVAGSTIASGTTSKPPAGRTKEELMALMPVPMLEVVGLGTNPIGAFTDIRCDNVCQYRLHSRLNIAALNTELSSPVTSEDKAANRKQGLASHGDAGGAIPHLKQFEWDIPPEPVSAPPSVVHSKFENVGSLPMSWVLKYPSDREVEMENWVDPGRPSNDQLSWHRLVQSRIFSVYPRQGILQPGESCSITVTYRHDIQGELHRLPVILEVDNGPHVVIVLSSFTLAPELPHLDFDTDQHTFVPVPLGEICPPLQSSFLYNRSLRDVEYHLDLAGLAELKAANYGFDILTCMSPTGVIGPGDCATIDWCFHPLEEKLYSVEIPVYMNGMDQAAQTVTFQGLGYHPKETALGSSAELRTINGAFDSMPSLQVLQVDTQEGYVSVDRLLVGNVPAKSVNRCVLTVRNKSDDVTLGFSWNISCPRLAQDLILEPDSGVLPPGTEQLIKVTFIAGYTPAIFDTDLRCDFYPADGDAMLGDDALEEGEGEGDSDSQGPYTTRSAEGARRRRRPVSARNRRSVASAEPGFNYGGSVYSQNLLQRTKHLESLSQLEQPSVTLTGTAPRHVAEPHIPGPYTVYVNFSAWVYERDHYVTLFGTQRLAAFYLQPIPDELSNTDSCVSMASAELGNKEAGPADRFEVRDMVSDCVTGMLNEALKSSDVSESLKGVAKYSVPYFAHFTDRPQTPVQLSQPPQPCVPRPAAFPEMDELGPKPTTGGDDTDTGTGDGDGSGGDGGHGDHGAGLHGEDSHEGGDGDHGGGGEVGVKGGEGGCEERPAPWTISLPLPAHPSTPEPEEAEQPPTPQPTPQPAAPLIDPALLGALLPDFKEVMEDVLEETLWNLISEAEHGEFNMTDLPRTILTEDIVQLPADLTSVFKQFDTDGSGALSCKELKRAMQAIGIKKADFEKIFESFDADGDGSVTLEEFDGALVPRTRRLIEEALNKDGVMEGFRPLVDVARVFAQIDTDDSGSLTVIELKRALACLGLKKVDIDETMKAFDTDGDGAISLEEWKQNLSKKTMQLMSKKLDENGLLSGFVDDGRNRKAAAALTEAAPAADGEAAAAAAP